MIRNRAIEKLLYREEVTNGNGYNLNIYSELLNDIRSNGSMTRDMCRLNGLHMPLRFSNTALRHKKNKVMSMEEILERLGAK